MIRTVKNINDEDVDIRFCDCCGEEIDELIHHYWGDERGDFCCLECFVKDNKDWEDTLTVENANRVGADNLQKIMINDFLYTVFTNEQIEDILYKEFKMLPETKQKELIRKYAEEDENSWLVTLDEYNDKSAKIILECEVLG